MNVLVTAGPTREWIDAVRFISNPSTGRMGYAVAREAAARGHHVDLVSGPTKLDIPPDVVFHAVETADQMAEVVLALHPGCDALVMSAAVGDWKPTRRLEGKGKKGESRYVLELTATRDILAAVAPSKGPRLHLGFAVETDEPIANARSKLERKNLDWILLNAPSSFGAETADYTLISKDGSLEPLGDVKKETLARRIVDLLEAGGPDQR